MLTKSLHTVTAATNVARLLLQTADKAVTGDLALARAALAVLGYSDVAVDRDGADDTVARIVKACAKLLSESQGPRKGIYENDKHAPTVAEMMRMTPAQARAAGVDY